MKAYTLQQIYLQLLYSKEISDIPESLEKKYIAETINTDRLKIERSARIRNLRSVLHTDMRLLSRYIDKVSLLPYIELYCTSNFFWLFRGRTLIEDLCVFLVKNTDMHPYMKVIAQIEGIFSALSTEILKLSPWGENSINTPNKMESFSSSFIFDPAKLIHENSIFSLNVKNKQGKFYIIRESKNLRITVTEKTI